ncbi:MAG: hypothetical protein K2Q22_10510 [Cytophagales bacterium]|nr:hypothetical protein [Cytophagales bacterium]
MHKLILFVGMILLGQIALSQIEYRTNSADFEKITYSQYQNKSWQELINTGNAALNENLDFFYLRLRLGIAYFELKQYRMAESHFIKAYEFNHADTVVLEYLYYSHLLSGHYEHAQKLSAGFDSTMKAKTGIGQNPLQYAFADGGVKISSSPRLFSNATFFEVGLGHRLTPFLSVNHMYTTYGQRSYFGEINQNQYYLSFSIPIAHSWKLSPAFHYVNYAIDTSRLQNIPTETKFISPMPGLIASLQLRKSFTYLELISGYAYSTLNNKIQHQGTFGIVAFPLASQKLAIGLNGLLQQRIETAEWSQGFRFQVSYAPHWKIKITVNYYHGNLVVFSEENAMWVNNSFYATQNQVNLLLEWNLSRKFSAFGLYQFENKTHMDSGFYYNTWLFGLKYKF